MCKVSDGSADRDLDMQDTRETDGAENVGKEEAYDADGGENVPSACSLSFSVSR
jgi:hypothetical protein